MLGTTTSHTARGASLEIARVTGFTGGRLIDLREPDDSSLGLRDDASSEPREASRGVGVAVLTPVVPGEGRFAAFVDADPVLIVSAGGPQLAANAVAFEYVFSHIGQSAFPEEMRDLVSRPDLIRSVLLYERTKTVN